MHVQCVVVTEGGLHTAVQKGWGLGGGDDRNPGVQGGRSSQWAFTVMGEGTQRRKLGPQ